MQHPELEQLILDIHATASRPEGWVGVLDSIARWIDADSGLLLSTPEAGANSFCHVPWNLDPEALRQYGQHYGAHDEWLIGARRTRRDRPGQVSIGEQFLPREQFLRSAYFNEFLSGYEMDRLVNVCLQGPLQPGSPPRTGINFYRKPKRESFTPQQVAFLKQLAPHMTLAVRNLASVHFLGLLAPAYTQSLDHVATPLYVLGGRGHILYANQAAEDVEGCWLTSTGGRLKPSRQIRNAADVEQALLRLRNGFACALVLEDVSGHQAILRGAPFNTTETHSFGDRATGAVWITPFQAKQTPIAELSRLFRLTPAEGVLVQQLAEHEDLADAAQAIGVSHHTARSQLKSVFRKTGRHSQTLLFSLMERMGHIRPVDRRAPAPSRAHAYAVSPTHVPQRTSPPRKRAASGPVIPDDLILKIHSTVLEPAQWTEVMADLSSLLGAESGLLFCVPRETTSQLPWHVSHRPDPDMMGVYTNVFVTRDEWLLGAQRQGRDSSGIVSVGEQLQDRSNFSRSSFYNDFAARYGMDRFLNLCIEGAPAPGVPPQMAISFYRPRGAPQFDFAQSELLTRLAPHLMLAARNLRHLQTLSTRVEGYARALDQVSTPGYLIDASGGLVFANGAGESALARGRWLRSRGGKLQIGSGVVQKAAALKALTALQKRVSSTTLLTDEEGLQALLIAAPLNPSHQDSLPIARAVGMLWTLTLQPDADSVTRLANLFELTAAEKRLLLRLAKGESLTEAAAVLGVKQETARSQLKWIFRKTGRHSQAGLMSLIQRCSAMRG